MTTRPLTRLIRRGAQRAFTLLEMLIVAALIALFAGLAVFNITEQYELNKQKAAVAECRHIGTAMNFALTDLGFFPKMCFLRFNYSTLIDRISTLPLNGFEYHGHLVGNIGSRLRKNWSQRGAYAGFNFDKISFMRIGGPSGPVYEWPADPWRGPYVAYFIHTETEAGANGTQLRQRFIERAGESPDYFAGIVSYGRNAVPGLTTTPDNADVQNRKTLRLYKETGQFNVYDALVSTEYTDVLASMIVAEPQNPDPIRPRIRDELSDDLVFEF